MTAGPAAPGALDGRRVLVVEDEVLVFMLIESVLEEHGARVLPPASKVAAALEAAERDAFDAAVLDVNVAGEPIYPVAAALARRGVPFLFLTGYGEGALVDPWRDRPVVQKPFRDRALVDALARCLAAGPPPPPPDTADGGAA